MEDNKDTSTETQVVEEDKTQVVAEVVETKEETKDDTQVVDDKDSTNEEQSEDDSSQDDDDSDDSEITKALKKVRNEARNLRTRLKDANAEIERLKANSNDEVVRERDDLARQLQDLKLEVRSDKTRSQVVDAARKAGAIEPDAIADALMGKVEYDESDKPTNIDKVITDYKSTYKRLFGGALSSGNIGNRNERGSKFEGMSAHDLLVNAFKSNDD